MLMYDGVKHDALLKNLNRFCSTWPCLHGTCSIIKVHLQVLSIHALLKGVLSLQNNITLLFHIILLIEIPLTVTLEIRK